METAAAFGVILTMLFVGLELRRSNIEASLSNTRDQLTMLSTFKAVTNDQYMADLVQRGRASYTDLNASEKIAFGLYLEQGIHASMAVYYHSGRDITDAQASMQSSERHLKAILDHPGAREWWVENRQSSPLIDFGRRRVDDILGT
ncbi:hypothetical protein [Ruegeria sp. PrR005]|uniref:DUF4760 domain-containing protein n=1 Tax=Ruegeria sp. PrR005 TaxID=2706882 RepID=A0A6B2NXS1_9RHOB|nr:hypothetical protein [Ruegeria sp. PrR005]NDW46705.1 hypothetical protein [Ruegeria sp. PrR005]